MKKTKSEVGAMKRKSNASFVVVVIVCTYLLGATRIVGQDPNPLAEAEQAAAAAQAEQAAAEQAVAARAATLEKVVAASKAAEDLVAKAKIALDGTEGDIKAQAQKAFDASQQVLVSLQEAIIKPVQPPKLRPTKSWPRKQRHPSPHSSAWLPKRPGRLA